jgi:hypothetical protein
MGKELAAANTNALPQAHLLVTTTPPCRGETALAPWHDPINLHAYDTDCGNDGSDDIPLRFRCIRLDYINGNTHRSGLAWAPKLATPPDLPESTSNI